DVAERRVLDVVHVLRETPRAAAVEQPHAGHLPAAGDAFHQVRTRTLATKRQPVDARDGDAMPAVALVRRALDKTVDVGDERVGRRGAANLISTAVLFDHL